MSFSGIFFQTAKPASKNPGEDVFDKMTQQ